MDPTRGCKAHTWLHVPPPRYLGTYRAPVTARKEVARAFRVCSQRRHDFLLVQSLFVSHERRKSPSRVSCVLVPVSYFFSQCKIRYEPAPGEPISKRLSPLYTLTAASATDIRLDRAQQQLWRPPRQARSRALRSRPQLRGQQSVLAPQTRAF